jgi:hypothetical protein
LTQLERHKAYLNTFASKEGQFVKTDLASFCCYNSSTMAAVDNRIDHNRMLIHEGRRQVFLYILANLVEPKKDKEKENAVTEG